MAECVIIQRKVALDVPFWLVIRALKEIAGYTSGSVQQKSSTISPPCFMMIPPLARVRSGFLGRLPSFQYKFATFDSRVVGIFLVFSIFWSSGHSIFPHLKRTCFPPQWPFLLSHSLLARPKSHTTALPLPLIISNAKPPKHLVPRETKTRLLTHQSLQIFAGVMAKCTKMVKTSV